MKNYEQAIEEAVKYLAFTKISNVFTDEELQCISDGQSTTIAAIYGEDEELTNRKIWWKMQSLTANDFTIAEWYDEYYAKHVEE